MSIPAKSDSPQTLLDLLIPVLKTTRTVDQKKMFQGQEDHPILPFCDLMQDLHHPAPEFNTFQKRMQPVNIPTLRLSTVVEAVAKFGTRLESRIVRKALRMTLKGDSRRNSKKSKEMIYKSMKYNKHGLWSAFLQNKLAQNIERLLEKGKHHKIKPKKNNPTLKDLTSET